MKAQTSQWDPHKTTQPICPREKFMKYKNLLTC